MELVDPARVEAEAAAIRRVFTAKRSLMLRHLYEMGIGVDREPDGTLYVFAHLRDLSPALGDGMAFSRRALDAKVITVPGVFFDVNPGRTGGTGRGTTTPRLLSTIASVIVLVVLRASISNGPSWSGGKPHADQS